MAEFTLEYFQTLKQSFPDMDLLNNLGSFDNLNSNEPMDLSDQLGFQQLPMNFHNNNDHDHDHISSSSMDPNNVPVYDDDHHHVAAAAAAHFFPSGPGTSHAAAAAANNMINRESESDFLFNSCSSIAVNDLVGDTKKKGNENGKKRKRKNERKVEKPREVIHVRAKRGQATDSHSLAERLRREKINEKFRSLQDLVPGCYKTMGMAVMLDVIINYVRSLQNQIDFLSMKLSAASLYHDFNSPDMDAIGGMQGMNAYEANGMERMVGHEGYEGLPPPQFQPSWPR